MNFPQFKKSFFYKSILKNLKFLELSESEILILCNYDMGSFINHVDRAGGGGFLEKPCLSTWGREGLEACPRGQKCFMATHFAHMNFGVTV